MWDIGDKMADGAALMTNTKWTSRVLGTAWPRHTNRAVAEAMHANIQQVGLPQWSDADIALAKATQRVMKVPEIGLATGADRPAARPRGDSRRGEVRRPVRRRRRHHLDRADGGRSATRRTSRPVPGHNWANAIPMATPIAHKGVNAGARVQALTALDLVLRPELVQAANDYFQNVQLKQRKYTPFIRPTDQPAIWMNKATMDRYRPEMRKYLLRLDQVQDLHGPDGRPVRHQVPDDQGRRHAVGGHATWTT